MEYVRSPFDPAEFEALARLAESNIRPVPDEVRRIVRDALRDAGMLTSVSEHPPTKTAPR